MPRGGARRGAGRPKNSGTAAWLHHSQGHRGERPDEAAPGAIQAVAMVDEPADLPEVQSSVWRTLAPLALAKRTLTPERALAFRDLCEAITIKRELLEIIQKDGYTVSKVTLKMDESGGGVQLVEPKAHPLISRFTAMMVRVETGLRGFKLAPDGKDPVLDANAGKPKSPLEQLQEQASKMRRPVGL